MARASAQFFGIVPETFGFKRLTNRTYHFAAQLGKPRTDYTADEVGNVADIFQLSQAAGRQVCYLVNWALYVQARFFVKGCRQAEQSIRRQTSNRGLTREVSASPLTKGSLSSEA